MRGVVVAKAVILGLPELRVIVVVRAVDLCALAKLELVVRDRHAAKVRAKLDLLLEAVVLIILVLFLEVLAILALIVIFAVLFVVLIALRVLVALEVTEVVLRIA